MKVTTIAIAIGLLTLAGCVKDSPEQAEKKQWTHSKGDDDYQRVLALKVSDISGRYALGQPIPITVQLRNLGPTDPESKHPRAQLFAHIDIWIEKDNTRWFENIKLPGHDRISIDVNDTFTCNLDLKTVRAFTEPGVFTVRVGHQGAFVTDLGDWTGTVRSAPMTVTILDRIGGKTIH